LTLGIPVQHYVEAIGGTSNIARLGNIVVGAHPVTKPTSVVGTNAGIAAVEQYDLRMP